MPFIDTKTNQPITGEKREALTKGLGKAISCLGKSESWLMLSFEDNCAMAFRGSADEPLVFADVSLYGAASAQSYDKMTAALTKLYCEQLGVSPDHVYVKYSEIKTWGWNGGNL